MVLDILAHGFAAAQVSTDVLGMHNLTAGSGSSVSSQGSLGCTFCHAPHSGLGGVSPLWNQKLSKSTYTPYTSTTYVEQGKTQPTLGIDEQPLPELSRWHGRSGISRVAYGTHSYDRLIEQRRFLRDHVDRFAPLQSGDSTEGRA